MAIQSLVSFIKFDPTFKDVFREMGMIEVLAGVLKLHLNQINEATSSPSQMVLGERVTRCVPTRVNFCVKKMF